MRRIATFALLVGATLMVAASPAFADDAILSTTLNGAKEVTAQGVPNQGDPDGSGSATVLIDDDSNTLCIFLRYRNLDTPTGFHIHGPAGPNTTAAVLVPFANPSGGFSFQCVNVANEALLDNIAANPSQYYTNVHTTVYPAGAIRGQLANA